MGWGRFAVRDGRSARAGLLFAADDVTGDTVIEQTQIWYDQAGEPVATATYERLPGDTSTTGELTAANSYVAASVVWYDGLGRTTATADYGREDVDSGLTHYIFNGTTGRRSRWARRCAERSSATTCSRARSASTTAARAR